MVVERPMYTSKARTTQQSSLQKYGFGTEGLNRVEKWVTGTFKVPITLLYYKVAIQIVISGVVKHIEYDADCFDSVYVYDRDAMDHPAARLAGE